MKIQGPEKSHQSAVLEYHTTADAFADDAASNTWRGPVKPGYESRSQEMTAMLSCAILG